MTEKIVDCRGQSCPSPVINTKKALEEGNDTLLVIVDNDISRQNVAIFARNNGCQVAEEQREGAYHLTLKTIDVPVSAPAQDLTSASTAPAEKNIAQGQVYFITTNTIGQGSPDLGQVLMKSLFVTLAANSPKPAAILLLNTGVFLACQESPVLEQLEQLHKNGTAVLACGTCLNYYKLNSQLVCGTVSNMLDINNWLCAPYRVITIA